MGRWAQRRLGGSDGPNRCTPVTQDPLQIFDGNPDFTVSNYTGSGPNAVAGLTVTLDGSHVDVTAANNNGAGDIEITIAAGPEIGQTVQVYVPAQPPFCPAIFDGIVSA